MLHPVFGDVDAARDPDLVVAFHVIDEALQRRGTAGTADQTAVEADIEHFRAAGLALGVEHVEGVAQIGEELVAGVEALRGGEAHVVAVERVGDDELVPAVHLDPVGQVVRIGVGNIVEAALGNGKRHRVHRGAAEIEAARTRTRHLGVQRDRLRQMLALLLDRHVLVFDPFVAVRGDLPIGLLHGRDLLRRTGQRGRDAVDGDRHGGGGEHAVQAPEAGACAIFVDRLHVPVALARPVGRADDLRQERLGLAVAVQQAVFAAFLVVDDELHGDTGAIRPCRVGRCRTVAAHVTGIMHLQELRSPDSGIDFRLLEHAREIFKFLLNVFNRRRTSRANGSSA